MKTKKTSKPNSPFDNARTNRPLEYLCDSLTASVAHLEMMGWNDEGMYESYARQRKEVMPRVAKLVDRLVQAGLVTVCVWKGKRFVELKLDSAVENGGVQLNAQFRAVGHSVPPPAVKMPGIVRKGGRA